MNPVSAFFVRNIIVVFFFYGLAFFALGLVLILAARRRSEFRFAQAIRPLAAFGILHGLHEWYEMYQKYAALTGGYTPGIWEEMVRLALLVASFVGLLAFGVSLLAPTPGKSWRAYLSIGGMLSLWALGIIAVKLRFAPSPEELIAVADALARYSLGIPGAMLGAWALMAQQRTFRAHNLPQFGRDLVWCAAAMLLYGVVGQIFVRPTLLTSSQLLSSTNFLQWFGVPVQLFRAGTAAVLTFYMARALHAFEVEGQRRLEQALLAERRVSQERERLNADLRLTAQELSLLLNLSNLLAAPLALQERLAPALAQIVQSHSFAQAGLILLDSGETQRAEVQVAVGFATGGEALAAARNLGEASIHRGAALCSAAGRVQEIAWAGGNTADLLTADLVALPLLSAANPSGALVLACQPPGPQPLPLEEAQLMTGIARQLGLSIENAELTWQVHRHEALLAELLDRLVDTQEVERQRIARELHDATGQSLTAIALGLRGVQRVLERRDPASAGQLRELESFSTSAIGELRRIIADLRPPQLDDLGLAAALRWYTHSFQARWGVPCEFQFIGEAARLPSDTETVIFRIAQEALANVARHADAQRAAVCLEIQPGAVVVTISDDGRGFDTGVVLHGERPRTGWGLLGIQERTRLLHGHCAIHSAPGQGTTLRVTIPLQEEAEGVQNSAVAG